MLYTQGTIWEEQVKRLHGELVWKRNPIQKDTETVFRTIFQPWHCRTMDLLWMRLGHVVSLNFTTRRTHRKAWPPVLFKVVYRWHIVTQVSLVSDSVTFSCSQVASADLVYSPLDEFIRHIHFLLFFGRYLMVHQWNSKQICYESITVSLEKSQREAALDKLCVFPARVLLLELHWPVLQKMPS